ncbi:MAG: fluoride efflux transporter CrcB [Gemmatimonadetes bacterium]|nr:fluoride efflux transporter CrcB [Gemmatimonadota bacterium]
MVFLVVAFGGATGAVARYLLAGWVQTAAGTYLPWGTLAVNVSGSLAIGFVAIWLQSLAVGAGARELIAVGFLGSFTTFSSISIEAVELIRLGAWSRAAVYTLGSMATGVLAAALGVALASALFSRGS